MISDVLLGSFGTPNIFIISHDSLLCKENIVNHWQFLLFKQKIIVEFSQIANWIYACNLLYYKWRKEGTIQWEFKLELFRWR